MRNYKDRLATVTSWRHIFHLHSPVHRCLAVKTNNSETAQKYKNVHQNNNTFTFYKGSLLKLFIYYDGSCNNT